MIEARLASLDDELFLYQLLNDSSTRSMMKTKEQVSLESHKKWFADRMRLMDSPIYILHTVAGCKRIGVVRFIAQERDL